MHPFLSKYLVICYALTVRAMPISIPNPCCDSSCSHAQRIKLNFVDSATGNLPQQARSSPAFSFKVKLAPLAPHLRSQADQH